MERMEKQLSAVEWFGKKVLDVITTDEFNNLLEQAKEIFEEQIQDAFDHGDMIGRAAMIRELDPNDKVVLKYPEMSSEEYYNKTFKSE